jgi:hypothetical protein
MYWYDIKHHKSPHFHAMHGGKMAAFNLRGELIAGNLGKRANRQKTA